MKQNLNSILLNVKNIYLKQNTANTSSCKYSHWVKIFSSSVPINTFTRLLFHATEFTVQNLLYLFSLSLSLFDFLFLFLFCYFYCFSFSCLFHVFFHFLSFPDPPKWEHSVCEALFFCVFDFLESKSSTSDKEREKDLDRRSFLMPFFLYSCLCIPGYVVFSSPSLSLTAISLTLSLVFRMLKARCRWWSSHGRIIIMNSVI